MKRIGRWPQWEVDMLIKLVKAGHTYAAASSLLNRKPDSTRKKIKELQDVGLLPWRHQARGKRKFCTAITKQRPNLDEPPISYEGDDPFAKAIGRRRFEDVEA